MRALLALLPMREWCGCGASVRGTRGDVHAWRTSHRHGGDAIETPDVMVPPTGGTSSTETTWAPIGFIPNEA